MLKNTLLKFCFIFLLFYQFSFCSDISLEKEKKFIIYQIELDQLKSNLNNIEKEKNSISETLKLQTISFDNLTKNLTYTEQTLNQSEKKIILLENNLTELSLKMKNQENIQNQLVTQLTNNQTQLMDAEKSLTEYKKEVKSQAFKNTLNNIIYFVCGVGIGIVTEKVIP